MKSSVRVDGERAWNGKVRQGQAYGVPRTDQRVKVRMGNRKVMDTKQGSWKNGTRGNRDRSFSTELHRV